MRVPLFAETRYGITMAQAFLGEDAMSADLLIARAVLGLPAGGSGGFARTEHHLETATTAVPCDEPVWALRMWDLAVRQIWPEHHDGRYAPCEAVRPGCGRARR